jgi:hypothetical protein
VSAVKYQNPFVIDANTISKYASKMHSSMIACTMCLLSRIYDLDIFFMHFKTSFDLYMFSTMLKLLVVVVSLFSCVFNRNMQFLFSYVFNLSVASVLDLESHYSVPFDKYPCHKNKFLDVTGRIVDT